MRPFLVFRQGFFVLTLCCRLPQTVTRSTGVVGSLPRCGNKNKDEDNSPRTLNDKKKPATLLQNVQLLTLKENFYNSCFQVYKEVKIFYIRVAKMGTIILEHLIN